MSLVALLIWIPEFWLETGGRLPSETELSGTETLCFAQLETLAGEDGAVCGAELEYVN